MNNKPVAIVNTNCENNIFHPICYKLLGANIQEQLLVAES